MMDKVAHPELAHWAHLIEQLRWAGFLLDQDHRLIWASPDIQRFLGSPKESELGYGLHVLQAFTNPPWRQLATTDSGRRLLSDLAPYVLLDAAHDSLLEGIPEEFHELLSTTDPRPFTRPVATSFDHVELHEETELPVSRVNVMAVPLRDDAGTPVGAVLLGYMGVRPALVSLLARGDEAMYERMAKLVEPQSHQGAILFCDLQGSTDLSRSLPTAEYFRLIRSLWTAIDALVARRQGIVGKHAGDGASAFFLVNDLGSASEAAMAAIRTARAVHDSAEEVFGETPETSRLMRVGLHWGSSLYIGQLVPGGRLDITALGDPVNECARIQECAGPQETLASKQLIEQLSQNDAASIGIDPEKIRYRPLAELWADQTKAIAGAGAIPVAVI